MKGRSISKWALLPTSYIAIAFLIGCSEPLSSESILGEWTYRTTGKCDDPKEQAKLESAIGNADMNMFSCEFLEGNIYRATHPTFGTTSGFYRVNNDSLIIEDSEGNGIGYRIVSFNHTEFITESKLETGKNAFCVMNGHYTRSKGSSDGE